MPESEASEKEPGRPVEPPRNRYVDLGAQLIPLEPTAGAHPDLGESLDLLYWAVQNGFSNLGVLCPVSSGGALEPTAVQRLDQLREAAHAVSFDIGLHASPLAPLSVVNDQTLGALRSLALGPHRLVFVELPRTHDLKGAARVMRLLPFAGLTAVVLAPERHPEVQRLPELLRYVLQVGALCAADAGCLLGEEGHGCAITAGRVWGLGYYSFVTGFVRGSRPPVAPDLVTALVPNIVSTWRQPQGRATAITERARRLLEDGSK